MRFIDVRKTYNNKATTPRTVAIYVHINLQEKGYTFPGYTTHIFVFTTVHYKPVDQ